MKLIVIVNVKISIYNYWKTIDILCFWLNWDKSKHFGGVFKVCWSGVYCLFYSWIWIYNGRIFYYFIREFDIEIVIKLIMNMEKFVFRAFNNTKYHIILYFISSAVLIGFLYTVHKTLLFLMVYIQIYLLSGFI